MATAHEWHCQRISQDQQLERFREMAKQLECDEDEAAFRDKLRTIAKLKPKNEPKPKKGK